jgi:pyrimidine deaminase RibD-like protein
MILNDFAQPKSKFSNDKLDAVLAELCELVLQGQKEDPELNGRVGAAVLDPKGRLVTGVGYKHNGKSVHGEYSAIENYENEYGQLPKGCIIITTLSPCNESHDKTADERYGKSCTDLLNSKHIKMAYCGYGDYTQDGDQHKFTVVITSNDKIKKLCKKIADTFLKRLSENVTEGKEQKPVVINTNTDWIGATIDKPIISKLPVTTVPFNQLEMWEKDKNLNDPKIANWVKQTLLPELEKNGKLKPMAIMMGKGKYLVIDGNHRYLAYQAAGFKNQPVPVQLVPKDMIEYSTEKPADINENFADGRGPGRPGDSQRHGIPKGATMAELEKASHANGRKGQLARWQINMRRGKKK